MRNKSYINHKAQKKSLELMLKLLIYANLFLKHWPIQIKEIYHEKIIRWDISIDSM